MNFQEVVSILKEKLKRVSQFAHEDFDMVDVGLGSIELIDKYGGEGQGEEWYVVFYLDDHDMYIRVDGWYSSGNGVEFFDGWNCLTEVRPKQKTITVYESI